MTDTHSDQTHSVSRGPYFDELTVGQVFDGAPEATLTEGQAAVHQAILGDRLRLPLSHPLARRVTGRAPLAHPALVWNVAIGQSTLVTQHVRANLFYRGLVLKRLPSLGDTLRTVTTVTGLRQNTVRPGRPATGMALLHMVTTDQDERTVLDFHRCAMIPLSSPDAVTSHRDDLGSATAAADIGDDVLLESAIDWKLPAGDCPTAGARISVGGGDVVSGAPGLARLALNIAAVHHDAVAAGGRRLVYGGHTIGVALSQATRALPDLVTVLGWHSCDHLAPVHEDDRLTSVIEVERVAARAGGGQVAHLRSRVTADDGRGGAAADVLDWRFAALFP